MYMLTFPKYKKDTFGVITVVAVGYKETRFRDFTQLKAEDKIQKNKKL